MNIADLAAHFGLSVDEVQRRAEQLKLPASDPYAQLNPRDEAELAGSLSYTGRRSAAQAMPTPYGPPGAPPPMAFGPISGLRGDPYAPAAPAYKGNSNRAVVGIVLIVVLALIGGGIALLLAHSDSSGGSSADTSPNAVTDPSLPNLNTIPLPQYTVPPVTQFTVPQFTLPPTTQQTTIPPLSNVVQVGTCVFRGFESMSVYNAINPPPVPTESCSAPQAAYVYLVEPTFFGQAGDIIDTSYPSDIQQDAENECQLHETAAAEANSPTNRILFVYPSEGRWNAGDRSLICMSD